MSFKNIRLPAKHISLIAVLLLSSSGCSDLFGLKYRGNLRNGLAPNGAISKSVWGEQEDRAEASKMVIHEHEFKKRSLKLNTAGEDHVKQIAAVLQSGVELPVVIERSMDKQSKGERPYPVDPDPELDNQRREVIVSALRQMGISNADEFVVVAPAFAQSASGMEAEMAYWSGLSGNRNSGAFGGGFGGFGGFGGGGGAGVGAGGISSSIDPTSSIADVEPTGN